MSRFECISLTLSVSSSLVGHLVRHADVDLMGELVECVSRETECANPDGICLKKTRLALSPLLVWVSARNSQRTKKILTVNKR